MISAVQDGKIYEFGDFRLIPGEDLLLHNGKQVTLNPKAFAVLTLLVERHGHLVQKSEIIDQIWEGAFVEEGAISKSVWFVRSVLGDASKEKFIQTIPRRGYRFVAPVTVLNDPSEFFSKPTELISTGFRLPVLPKDDKTDPEFISVKEQAASNGSDRVSEAPLEAEAIKEREALEPIAGPESVRMRFGRFRALAVWIGIAAVLLGGVVLYRTFSERNILGKGDTSRMAVLPFKPLNAEIRDPIYELGIADSLIVKIGSSPKLTVKQLNAVRNYVGLEIDPIAVGKEQNVDYVLSANYQLANGRIKVTSQLIDVATGKVEDTFNVEKDAVNLFSAQEAIANDIGNRLLARFGSDVAGVRLKRGTDNEEAYRLYQLAMTLVAKGGTANIEAAIVYLDKAVSLDPNYARAWAGKAYAHAQDAWGGRGSPNREEIPRSVDAVQKALSIDPDLSEAHTVLCGNRLFFEYDSDGAETACRRAVALDPNSSVAHLAYSRLLNSRSRFNEAFAEVKIAMDLDPASFHIQRQYANSFYLMRRYPEAEEQYKRAISLNPEEVGPYDKLIWTLEAQGKESEAFDCLIKWYEIRKDGRETPEIIKRFKAAYAASGWLGAVTELIRSIEARKNPNHYALAGWYAALGNKDKAFENLEKAYQDRNMMMMFIRVDNHHFDILRDDPRFADLVRRIEGK